MSSQTGNSEDRDQNMPDRPETACDLSVDLAGVKLANPIMTASGTCGYADEYADFVDLRRLGAFVTKSITVEPRIGNEYPRIVETRAGMLNAIGLANVGLDAFLDEKIPQLEKLGLPVFVNVAGTTVDDYLAVAEALEGVEIVRGVELNISCPNVKAGGIQFGADPRPGGGDHRGTAQGLPAEHPHRQALAERYGHHARRPRPSSTPAPTR